METTTQQFFEAVRQNEVERVRKLLQFDPTLVHARILGDATLLNEQIWSNKQAVDIGANEQRDTPALHHSVFHGHLDMVNLLLEFEADVNAIGYENNYEMTPAIVIAAWEGGIDVLHTLLKHGADPNIKSSNNVTALSTARRHQHTDRIKLLLEYGAIE